MAAQLEFSLVEDFSMENAERGRSAFLIRLENDVFAFLYMNRENYTLAWNGQIDFSGLHVEAITRLSFLISSGNLFLEPDNIETRIATFVSLLIEDQEDSLIEFPLEIDALYNRYKQMMRHPDKVSFVRYDINYKVIQPTLRYSFTAENPSLSGKPFGELAIRLPRSRECSELLLDWIIQHHSKRHFWDNVIDRNSLLRNLSAGLERFPKHWR